MKHKLTIAYDGTRYCGWQNQPHKISVQEEIERALARISHQHSSRFGQTVLPDDKERPEGRVKLTLPMGYLKSDGETDGQIDSSVGEKCGLATLLQQKVRIFGAGRTDAGVHALGQVAHVCAEKLPDLKSFNSALPEDIRITEIVPVHETFHAQYSSCNKIYHYHLWLKQPIPPHLRLYRHSPREKISLSRLQEGAKHFLGKQDFTTFANLGSSAKTSVRTLYRLDVVEQEGGVRLEFEGDGFLYKMVRNIMATLIEVASGKLEIAEIKRLLEAKDRRAGGMVAPARGLFLIHVGYPNMFSQSSSSEA